MREIKMSWVAKIQIATMKIFYAEDEDYPNYRVIRPNERAIDHYLSLITDNKEEQEKILRAIERENFNTKDRTYKPVCDNLRALGYVIKEGE